MKHYTKNCYKINDRVEGELVEQHLELLFSIKKTNPSLFELYYKRIADTYKKEIDTNNMICFDKDIEDDNMLIYEFDKESDGNIYTSGEDDNGLYVEFEE